MARNSALGSLTKEPPLERLDATLGLVTPGMTYDQLRAAAARSPAAHPDAPGLLVKRFLSLDSYDRIEYDGLLALVKLYGAHHPRVRKVMYFVWAWRDPRIAGFIKDVVAKTGRWRAQELTRKENASYFEDVGFEASSARKARSNYEFFLTEAGIFDPSTGSVHLELEDGWLSDAMAILAREEDDPAVRVRMQRDPVGFLMDRGLGALVNVAAGELRENYPGELTTWEPVDDRRIPEAGRKVGEGSKEWQPRDVATAGAKKAEYLVDLVAHERASRAHQELERLTAAAIKARGFEPRVTPIIDMYFETAPRTVLLEMKSCHAGNIHSQVRKGVSQLLEYRFVSRESVKGECDLGMVLESPPPAGKAWLTDYLVSVGICPAWKSADSKALITTAPVPATLIGVFQPVTT